MCRMLIAVGNIDMNSLVDSMLAMAKDETLLHERNQEKGLGSLKHSDGWGYAYLDENNNWIVEKSTQAIYEDEKANELKSIKPKAIVIHARKAMGSEISEVNTHPFYYKDEQGKEFVFCHNGYVEEGITYCTRFKLQGECDSEKLFYSLLTDLTAEDCPKSAISKNFQRYQNPLGVNFIFSTKEKSLIGVRQNNLPVYLTMKIGKTKDMTIVSSEQLTKIDAEWQDLFHDTIAEVCHTENKVRLISLNESIEPENQQ